MKRFVHAALVGALCTCALRAQVPHAGPDQVVAWPGSANLTGEIAGASPLEWWTADGNNLTEDELIEVSDSSGCIATGALHTANGTVLGWPGDFVSFAGTWWGVDVGQRRLYTLDPATAACTLVGTAPFSALYQSVNSLAYDELHDRLYAVDSAKKQLLLFDRTTGQPTPIGTSTLSGYPLVRSLAYDPLNQWLYAHDDATNWILRLDPNTGVVTPVIVAQPDPSARIEEFEFWNGALYATRGGLSGGMLVSGRIERVDLATGALTPIGPEVSDVSPHALHVVSVPERVHWSLVSGPGTVSFTDPDSLATAATFSTFGVYTLELHVDTSYGGASDTLEVTADGCPFDPLEIDPAHCHANGTPFCFGDGSGAPCACGNNGAAGQGCRNSTGAGARLDNTGGTSCAGDDLHLVSTQLPPGKAGLVFYGAEMKNGGLGVHYGDGLRCVGGHVKRFPAQSTGPGGTFAVGSVVAASGGAIGPGSTWYFQCWYRDASTVCGHQTNFSNALAITFQY